MPRALTPEQKAAAVEYNRRWRAKRRGGVPTPEGAVWPCPTCGKERSSPETLRVHRWLAHDEKTPPPVP